MKNKDLFHSLQNLKSLTGLKGVKFAYAVNRNIQRLEKETKRLSESAEPSSGFIAYDKEKRGLFLEYAEKDSDGNPKVFEENGKQVNKIPEDKLEKFKSAVDDLNSNCSESINEREEQLKEYTELLEEESEEFEYFTVDMQYVPEDITTDQMSIIMPMLREDD